MAPTVPVDRVGRNIELIQRCQNLGREGLVEFDGIDGGEREPGLTLQQLPGRGDRADAEQVGVNAGSGAVDEGKALFDAHASRHAAAHNEHQAGAVVQRAGIAGCYRTIGQEDRPEVCERLEGCSRTWALVPFDQTVAGGNVDDLGPKDARLGRRYGEPVAAKGEFILSLTRYAELPGDVFGGNSHFRVTDRVGRKTGRARKSGAAPHSALVFRRAMARC